LNQTQIHLKQSTWKTILFGIWEVVSFLRKAFSAKQEGEDVPLLLVSNVKRSVNLEIKVTTNQR
jgi:hypothetical protein